MYPEVDIQFKEGPEEVRFSIQTKPFTPSLVSLWGVQTTVRHELGKYDLQQPAIKSAVLEVKRALHHETGHGVGDLFTDSEFPGMLKTSQIWATGWAIRERQSGLPVYSTNSGTYKALDYRTDVQLCRVAEGPGPEMSLTDIRFKKSMSTYVHT